MPSSVSPERVEEGLPVSTPTVSPAPAPAPATMTTTAKTTAPESRKRSANTDDDQLSHKRQKTAPLTAILAVKTPSTPSQPPKVTTVDDIAKSGLRRSIALALQKVGFDSAAPEAMESFVAMTETYMTSLLEDARSFANASRRSFPLPSDFELVLKRHNLSTSSLKPHTKPPIPKSKRLPEWEPLPISDSTTKDLPVLGTELDGSSEKKTREYIPSSFPPFPSIHTYKHTPENVETVTAAEDWNTATADPQSQIPSATQTQPQSQTQRPLAPDEIPRGDPKKMREAAAKEAKAGEAALRGLMRASKIAKQKEVWLAAQQDAARRERYGQWESVMKDLMEEETKDKSKESALALTHGNQKRAEIADHAMIVNAEKRFYRREMPRTGTRRSVGEGVVGKG